MKKLVDFTVTKNVQIGSGCFLLELDACCELPKIVPGQFVNVLIEKAGVILRRPISIFNADSQKGTIALLIKKVGKGTIELSKISQGEKVNILLPLGNGFSMPSNNDKVLLVAGGVGLAPMYYFSQKLNEIGIRPSLLVGTKTLGEVILKDEFVKYADLYYTTEDGSYGEKGYPTQHSILKEHFDVIYSCGPTPMMKGIAQYASKNNIPCQVSLENKMACGIGACLCCVQETKDGHKCVCTTGPVFSIKDLTWQI